MAMVMVTEKLRLKSLGGKNDEIIALPKTRVVKF